MSTPSPPEIIDMSPVPDRRDEPTFSDRMNLFFSRIVQFSVDIGLTAEWTRARADEVESNATAAAISEANAASSAEVALGAANYKGSWSAQTGAANKPYSVTHNGRYWSLNNNLADVTGSEPGVTTDWVEIPSGKKTVVETAASRTTKDMDDNVVTAAGVTITAPANAPAGAEFTISTGEFTDTVVDGNGQNIMGVAETMTINRKNTVVTLRKHNTVKGWVLI